MSDIRIDGLTVEAYEQYGDHHEPTPATSLRWSHAVQHETDTDTLQRILDGLRRPESTPKLGYAA